MCPPHAPHHTHAQAQKGVVLILVMIFIVALSVLAIFSARNATLGERKSRNEIEYQVARQAAEAALRDAERDLQLPSDLNNQPNAVCNRGGSLLRTEDSLISEAEFTPNCLKGQCQVPVAQHNTAWDTATRLGGATPGEVWWPESRGGAWGDYFRNRTPNSAPLPDCDNFTGAVPLGLFTGAARLTGVARQPEYLIEYLPGPLQVRALNQGFACPTPLRAAAGGLASADANAANTPAQSLEMPCLLFRITARGYGPTENVQVLMQTYFHIVKP